MSNNWRITVFVLITIFTISCLFVRNEAKANIEISKYDYEIADLELQKVTFLKTEAGRHALGALNDLKYLASHPAEGGSFGEADRVAIAIFIFCDAHENVGYKNCARFLNTFDVEINTLILQYQKEFCRIHDICYYEKF